MTDPIEYQCRYVLNLLMSEPARAFGKDELSEIGVDVAVVTSTLVEAEALEQRASSMLPVNFEPYPGPSQVVWILSDAALDLLNEGGHGAVCQRFVSSAQL